MIKSQDLGFARADAANLDALDPLGGFRDRFLIDDQRLVYLDGNSLGRLPRRTLARLASVAEEEWGSRLVRAWEDGWMELPIEVGDRLGAELLGAKPGQVVIGDSTTVCFYKLVSAALDARPGRRRIITDLDNFPTDRYVLEGLARARGLSVDWLPADPSLGPTASGLARVLGTDTAVVTFSHTSYRSAFIAAMAEINALAHEAGALTLWDLSHSAGAMPLALDDDRTDLATGCSYKYLNGGPGAPAFMYVRRELQDQLRQPIWGWLGRRDPFAMEPGYLVAEGMRGFLSGTPPVLALAAVDEGVRLLAEAGIDRIRAKAIGLTELATALADARLAPSGVRVRSPREAERRGAHVALSHREAEALCANLIDRGVIVDFRRPDMIRFGCSPLTTRFVDVWDGVEALAELLL